MKRFVIILTLLLAAVGLAAWWLLGTEALVGLLAGPPEVTPTLYDTDADGQVDLVRVAVGEAMVVWRWDREVDGNPELVAYDAAVGTDGRLRPTGSITTWDYGADGVLDAGDVPAAARELLRREEVAAALEARPAGELALVGPEIRQLVERIRDGYDRWRLSGFRMPIVGASLPDQDSLLPGAARRYRNGVHQGFDMYPGHIGVPTGYGAPVVAANDGTVVRADNDFTEMSLAEYQEALAISRQQGSTSPESLDRLRGRQVWIDHGHGIVTRYCHLSGIAPGIGEGSRVAAGDIIGYVGNSGMEAGIRGGRADAHLHFELWIDDRYLGEGLTPEETRSRARRIFGLEEDPQPASR